MRLLSVVAAVVILAAPPAAGQEAMKSTAELELEASAEELARTEAELEETLGRVRAWRAALAARQAEAATRGGPPAATDDRPESVRIVNGVLTWAFPSTGALLHGADADSAGSHCTGTLVGCRTFLTANHCVERDRDPGRYFVYLQHGGIVPVAAISPQHAEYRFPHADLAVLRLAEPVEGIVPTPLGVAAVADGTRGTIVGFGRSGGTREDYGLKRAGRVRTARCTRPETSLLCWDFASPIGLPGEDSNTCNADSGGPLFVDLPSGPQVAGVTSGGSLSSCLASDHSYDVDVRQFVAWIGDHAEPGDLGATACGALPAIGAGGAESFGDARELAAGAVQDYRLRLPAGLDRLRLALNGEDTFATDFDLFVHFGAVADPAVARCARAGDGNYAFCEFDAPEPGDWFVRVRQKGSGRGTYQVVASLFGAAP